MASIQLHQLGKQFGTHWLFRNISASFNDREKIAITGKNGSGKSTLLHILSGFMRPTEGTLSLSVDGAVIPGENYYRYLSWAAPYVELVEDFTADEFLNFYIKHKPLMKGITVADLLRLSYLNEYKDQYIKNFSSGMKQRLKLVSAVLAETPLLLLDEPLSNLDEEGNAFYRMLMNDFTGEKTVIICSNNSENEISFCNRRIALEDYA